MSYKADDFIKAIPGTGGIIKNIAEAVGCSRTTVYKALEDYVTVKAAYEEETETFLDAAEERLAEKVMEGSMDAIKFYLRTKGRTRGYGDRLEHTGKDGGPVETRTVPWPEKDAAPDTGQPA